MRRYLRFVVLLGVGPCLPDNYFAQLLANSLTAVTGAVLSDLMNVVLPRMP